MVDVVSLCTRWHTHLFKEVMTHHGRRGKKEKLELFHYSSELVVLQCHNTYCEQCLSSQNLPLILYFSQILPIPIMLDNKDSVVTRCATIIVTYTVRKKATNRKSYLRQLCFSRLAETRPPPLPLLSLAHLHSDCLIDLSTVCTSFHCWLWGLPHRTYSSKTARRSTAE